LSAFPAPAGFLALWSSDSEQPGQSSGSAAEWRTGVRETVRIRTRDRLLAVLALAGFLLVCLAATAGRPAPHAQRPVSYPTRHPSASPSTGAPTDSAQLPPHHSWHLYWPSWLLPALVQLAGVVALLALLWLIVTFMPRWRQRRGGQRPTAESQSALPDLTAEVGADLVQTFSRALTRVELGDANRAIVACWIRLEQIAEQTGFARQPWETSTDLVNRWLAGVPLPDAALNRLAGLYREARYSGHAMDRESIEQARATLTELRMAFQTVPPTRS